MLIPNSQTKPFRVHSLLCDGSELSQQLVCVGGSSPVPWCKKRKTSDGADSTKILDDFEWPAYDVPQVTNQNPTHSNHICATLPRISSMERVSTLSNTQHEFHPLNSLSSTPPQWPFNAIPSSSCIYGGVRLSSPSAAQVSWPVSRPEVTPGWSKDLTLNQMTRKYRRWVASSRAIKCGRTPIKFQPNHSATRAVTGTCGTTPN